MEMILVEIKKLELVQKAQTSYQFSLPEQFFSSVPSTQSVSLLHFRDIGIHGFHGAMEFIPQRNSFSSQPTIKV